MFKVPYPVEQRNVVKQVRVGKGYDSKTFAKLWTLVLRESGGEKKRKKGIFSGGSSTETETESSSIMKTLCKN